MGVAVFDVGQRQRPHNMLLGAAIPVVGLAVRHARGGADLHGEGWRRRTAFVWHMLDARVLAVVLEVGRGSSGWRVTVE
jgi:hypothetical protein